ncbi:MAG TPA: AsmA family protein [Advenella sp.]|nr:AsmA family protein [Advenella sp.]
MKVWLKRILIGLVVLMLFAFVGAAVFLLTFDPNAYKHKIESIVQERYNRTMVIEGDLELSLFPRIGLSVRKISLSEPNSTTTFASIDSARFAVAIWPLMSNRLVVDHVAVSGLKGWIVRDEKGNFNFEDLLTQDPPAIETVDPRFKSDEIRPAPAAAAESNSVLPQPKKTDFKIDIAGLEVQNGALFYKDKLNNLDMRLNRMTVNTGRVTFDQPFDVSVTGNLEGARPVANASVNIQGLVKLDPVTKLYSARNLEANIKGIVGDVDVQTGTLTGDFEVDSFAHALTGSGIDLTISGKGAKGTGLRNLDMSLAAPKLNFDSTAPLLQMTNFAVKGTASDEDDESYEWVLNSPALDISPTGAGGKPLTGSVRIKGKEQFGVNFRMEGISGTSDALNVAQIKLDGAYARGNKRAVNFNLSSPAKMDLARRLIALSAMSGNVVLKDVETREQNIPVIGTFSADFLKSVASFKADAVINSGKFSFDGNISRFDEPYVRFAVGADSVNLDELIDNVSGDAATPPAAATGAAKAPAEPTQAEAKPTTTAVRNLVSDLMGALIGSGTVSLKQITYHGVVYNDVTAALNFTKDQLGITDIKSSIFDGQVQGDALINMKDDEVTTKLNFQDVSIEPLLKGLGMNPVMTGTGTFSLVFASRDAPEGANWLTNATGSLEGEARDGTISGFDLAPVLADPVAYANNVEQAGAWKFDPAAKTPYTTLKTKLVLDKGELHFTHFSLLTDPLLIQADDNLAVYNLLNDQFSFPGKFVTRQPVTLNQDGLRVSIKQVTLPFELTGSPENAQLKVKWQRLNNSPLGRFVKQRKDKEAEAQKQAAEQAAAQEAATSEPAAAPGAATEARPAPAATPATPETGSAGNQPPAQSAPAGQAAPDTPAPGDKTATEPASPAAPAK